MEAREPTSLTCCPSLFLGISSWPVPGSQSQSPASLPSVLHYSKSTLPGAGPYHKGSWLLGMYYLALHKVSGKEISDFGSLAQMNFCICQPFPLQCLRSLPAAGSLTYLYRRSDIAHSIPETGKAFLWTWKGFGTKGLPLDSSYSSGHYVQHRP